MDAQAASRTRQQRWRRRAHVALLMLLVIAVVEVVGAGAWWIATGSPFTWARAAVAREQALAGNESTATTVDNVVAAAQQAAAQRTVLHPFLGYVDDATD